MTVNKLKRDLTQEIATYVQDEVNKDPVTLAAFSKCNLTPGGLFQTPDSLRLRPLGHQILKTIFECYEFEEKDGFTTGDLMLLSKHMNGPFYIIKNKIAVYSNKHIVMFKIAGGVKSWLKTFS
jgi:hypothetical protein